MVLRSLSSDSPKVNQACRKGIGLLTAPGEGLRKKIKANNVRRFHFIIPINWGNWRVSSLFWNINQNEHFGVYYNHNQILVWGTWHRLESKNRLALCSRSFFEHYVFLFSVSIVPKFTWFRLFSFVFSASSSSSTSFALSEFVQRTLRFSEPFYIFYLNRIYFTLWHSNVLYTTLHYSTLFYFTLLYSTPLFFTLLYLTPL